MNKIVIILLILFVIYSLTRTEKFTNTPPDELNDEDVDLSGYEESDLIYYTRSYTGNYTKNK